MKENTTQGVEATPPTKIKKFDPAKLKKLRVQLKELFDKYDVDSGLKYDLGNCKYSDAEATFQLKILIDGELTLDEQAVEMFSNFKYGDFVFVAGIGDSKIVAYKTRSSKYPFIVESVDNGKRYKVAETSLVLKNACSPAIANMLTESLPPRS